MSTNVKELAKSASPWVASAAVISVVVFVLLQFGIIGQNNQLEILGNRMSAVTLSNESRFTKLETRQDYMDQQITELIRMVERNQTEIKNELKEIKQELKDRP